MIQRYTKKITQFHLISWCGNFAERNYVFPQNFHTRKSGEITVFFAVIYWDLIFRKRSANSFSTTFRAWLFKKNVSHISLSEYLYFEIFSNYCHWLFPRLWRHKCWKQPQLSNQAVFLHGPNIQDKNLLKVLKTKRAFRVK